ncbi:cytochrome P450 [Amylostereum chailletii]|nr:cytochrome P450 [Amylostereum chailletii]
MSTLRMITGLDIVAGLILLFALRGYINSRRRSLLPPGPRPLPVVGNLFDIPAVKPWVTYTSWGKKYGPISAVQVFGQSIIILNSVNVIKDLFERRGAFYSDRFSLPIVDMFGLIEWNFPSQSLSDTWRNGRKITDYGLRAAAVRKYSAVLQDKAHEFLRMVSKSPTRFTDYISLSTGSIMLQLLYGYQADSFGDPLLSQSEESMHILNSSVLPGALLVNTLPLRLPGMGFKILAERCKQLFQNVKRDTYGYVRSGMRNGTAPPSILRDYLEDNQNVDKSSSLDDGVIADAISSLYGPGVDTTVSMLKSLFLALALYPNVQQRSQEELDEVIGVHRLPSFDDRASLPYAEAVFRELLRWRLAVPLGLPHMTAKDDIYEGYLIPKGSIVWGNTWAILHDPETYPDPEDFKPERFLSPDGRVIDDPRLAYAFGYGRRICPGRHLVEQSLWIFTVSILFAFRVERAKNEMGHEIPLVCENSDTLVSHPDVFECTITPRNSRVEELINAPSVR